MLAEQYVCIRSQSRYFGHPFEFSTISKKDEPVVSQRCTHLINSRWIGYNNGKMIKLFKQIILFGFVGLATLIIDVVVTTGLYNMLHISAFLSSAAGFIAGFLFSFPINRNKVFQSEHNHASRFSARTQIVLYFSLCIFNLLTTSLLVAAIVSSDFVEIQYAKIAVTGLIAIWNFLLFKLFIFAKLNAK